MEQAFRALIVSAAPGGLTAVAINWGEHPQGAPWPGIVLSLVDDAEGVTLDGPSGLSTARVQVDCWAPTYRAASELGHDLRSSLNGHTDALFQGVFLIATRGGRDMAAPDRPFRASMDFEVIWNRS